MYKIKVYEKTTDKSLQTYEKIVEISSNYLISKEKKIDFLREENLKTIDEKLEIKPKPPNNNNNNNQMFSNNNQNQRSYKDQILSELLKEYAEIPEKNMPFKQEQLKENSLETASFVSKDIAPLKENKIMQPNTKNQSSKNTQSKIFSNFHDYLHNYYLEMLINCNNNNLLGFPIIIIFLIRLSNFFLIYRSA